MGIDDIHGDWLRFELFQDIFESAVFSEGPDLIGKKHAEAADVAEYSRLMGTDEEGTLAQLKAVRKALVDPAIASHRGRIVKTTGDGLLIRAPYHSRGQWAAVHEGGQGT